MVEFEHDRKIESETYALINFFQLLSQAEAASYSDLPEKTFLAIGGMVTTKKLVRDCEEERINIFANSVGTLFQQLEQNMEYLNGITVSKSTLVEGANEDFEIFKEFYSVSSGMHEEAYIDLASLHAIPAQEIVKILAFRPKSKKIGER